MQDQLSQYFLTTVDFINRSTTTLQNAYQQLMENRQLSAEEGKRMYEEFMQNTEARRTEFEAQVSKIFERVAENLHLATTTRVADLQTRLEALEARVAQLEKEKKDS